MSLTLREIDKIYKGIAAKEEAPTKEMSENQELAMMKALDSRATDGKR